MAMEVEVLGMNLSCLLASLRNFEVPSNRSCVLPLFSQALGYAIVAASSIVKLPQIYLILKNKSVQGLSATAFELEVVGYTVAVAFCVYKRLPFSTYGEMSFLLVQAIIVVGLIYNLTPNLGASSWVKAALYCALAPTILTGGLNPSLLEALYACQQLIFFFARVLQIVKNYQSKQTGQLSFLTSLLSLLRSAARLFTGIQAKVPLAMVAGSGLGIITHATLVSQILLYNRVKSH